MATTDRTYNGWTNYETWAVNLWMDNDAASYSYWSDTAREFWDTAEAKMDEHKHWSRSECARFPLADYLKEEYETSSQTMLEEAGQQLSVWADLLGAALSEVNWDEIADGWLERLDLDGYESRKA